jgi:hypothetical protein
MAKKKKKATAPNFYVIEIGLDGTVVPRSDGTYPYLMSLVKVIDFDSADGTPAWFTDVQEGDEFVFRVFNYNATNKFGRVNIDLKGLFARFLDPTNPKVAASCTNEDMICTGRAYYPDPLPPTASSCARMGAKGWRFIDDTGKEHSFQFTAGKKRARLHVSVAATYPGEDGKELRWFTHDPEIFVGESGRPPVSGGD